MSYLHSNSAFHSNFFPLFLNSESAEVEAVVSIFMLIQFIAFLILFLLLEKIICIF